MGPLREAAHRVATMSTSTWRRLPEPWRRKTFEVVPGGGAAAVRWRAGLRAGHRAVAAESDGPPVEETAADEHGLPYFALREQDVRCAYRLLLYRDPTAAEVERHLEQGAVDLEYDLYHFTDLLLSSKERDDAVAGLREPMSAVLDGLTFYYRPCDTLLGARIAHDGAYEPEVAAAIEHLLPRGGTFVDVGANIGLHAIRGARAVGQQGRVVCIEPNPDNVELLELTMVANGFDHVTVRPAAASDRRGIVPLHARRGQSNATVEQGTIRWASDVQLEVPSVRLDDELGDLDRLDLVKIDIEGAEPLALAGMRDTLERFKPPILMELFPDAIRRTSGAEPAELLTDLESMGYRLMPFIPGHGMPTDVYSIESLLALPDELAVTHIDVLAEPC